MFRHLLTALAMVLTTSALAAPLFDSDNLLAVTLNAPFKLIDTERDKDKEYAGSLSFIDPQLGPTVLDAKFSVRGAFRLREDICNHAQLWVNLKKSQVKGTLFAKQDKLKLVVRCKDSERYADYIGRERKAYQIFNALSDLSLATRMLNVTYTDSDGGDSRVQHAFFIQHQDNLAKQHDMTVHKELGGIKPRLDPSQSTVVALFMYLISNTDYSFVAAPAGENCCHNTKLLEATDGRLHPVPYDFDSTGFVDTSYAEPTAGMRQNNVKHRLYRGYCVDEAVIADTLTQFQAKRAAIYAIIDDPTYVTEKSIKRTRKYVDKFYAVL
ncbi:MAG: hypothetical protein AAFO81_13270, partial [Pseudomonadota bacterium]